jgi:hypothetical protein
VQAIAIHVEIPPPRVVLTCPEPVESPTALQALDTRYRPQGRRLSLDGDTEATP